MKVQVLVRLWKEVILPDEMTKEEAIAILEESLSVGDFFTDEIESKYKTMLQYDDLIDTEYDMTPEENDNQPTMELLDDDGHVIWDNCPTSPSSGLYEPSAHDIEWDLPKKGGQG